MARGGEGRASVRTWGSEDRAIMALVGPGIDRPKGPVEKQAQGIRGLIVHFPQRLAGKGSIIFQLREGLA